MSSGSNGFHAGFARCFHRYTDLPAVNGLTVRIHSRPGEAMHTVHISVIGVFLSCTVDRNGDERRIAVHDLQPAVHNIHRNVTVLVGCDHEAGPAQSHIVRSGCITEGFCHCAGCQFNTVIICADCISVRIHCCACIAGNDVPFTVIGNRFIVSGDGYRQWIPFNVESAVCNAEGHSIVSVGAVKLICCQAHSVAADFSLFDFQCIRCRTGNIAFSQQSIRGDIHRIAFYTMILAVIFERAGAAGNGYRHGHLFDHQGSIGKHNLDIPVEIRSNIKVALAHLRNQPHRIGAGFGCGRMVLPCLQQCYGIQASVHRIACFIDSAHGIAVHRMGTAVIRIGRGIAGDGYYQQSIFFQDFQPAVFNFHGIVGIGAGRDLKTIFLQFHIVRSRVNAPGERIFIVICGIPHSEPGMPDILVIFIDCPGESFNNMIITVEDNRIIIAGNDHPYILLFHRLLCRLRLRSDRIFRPGVHRCIRCFIRMVDQPVRTPVRHIRCVLRFRFRLRLILMEHPPFRIRNHHCSRTRLPMGRQIRENDLRDYGIQNHRQRDQKKTRHRKPKNQTFVLLGAFHRLIGSGELRILIVYLSDHKYI